MKKKILAVDESKAIRFLLQTILGRNYEIITATDGYAAIYWLCNHSLPDVIILDPMLGDMPDWELPEQLLSSGMYGHIPIIILSALPEEETQAKCELLGITEYFIQPFNPVELESAVERVTDPASTKKRMTLQVN